MRTTGSANIFQLAVFTTACYGASICRNPHDMKDLAHSIIISCSSQQQCQLFFFERVFSLNKVDGIDQIVADLTKMLVF